MTDISMRRGSPRNVYVGSRILLACRTELFVCVVGGEQTKLGLSVVIS